MADIVSKKKRSEIMSKIRSKDSKIEIEFRKALWKAGLRYRKNPKGYFGKPDLVLKKHKAVIFIDSCFWHGCKKHCRIPSTRQDYWIPKIERNKKRDKEVNRHYRNMEWLAFRIWEHDLKKDLDQIIDTIVKVIKK
jgi:DNA mismatch endonuclease (patch repair protein)